MRCEDDDQLRLILISGQEKIFENGTFAQCSDLDNCSVFISVIKPPAATLAPSAVVISCRIDSPNIGEADSFPSLSILRIFAWLISVIAISRFMLIRARSENQIRHLTFGIPRMADWLRHAKRCGTGRAFANCRQLETLQLF